MLPLKTVLHPTDFSASAAAAYRLACALARDANARLIVLHVAPEPTVVYGTGVVPADPVAEEGRLRERLREGHPDDPRYLQDVLLVHGDPLAEILRVAGENKADLIALGTHGRTGLTRLLLGSVAEQVLRKATCPVLVARTPTA